MNTSVLEMVVLYLESTMQFFKILSIALLRTAFSLLFFPTMHNLRDFKLLYLGISLSRSCQNACFVFFRFSLLINRLFNSC